jgi:dolichyl-phosphate-mannose--protein O-mannosyl transferase
MYGFHTGDQMANATHTYSSSPWGWLVLARPIGFDAVNGIQPGTDGCPEGDGTCLRIISGTGTPLLWWAAAITFILGLIWWLAGADWRFGVVSLATLATWVPWVGDTVGRPLFFFYAITLIPFLCIGLAMALGVLMGPANAGRRRFRGTILAGTVVGLIILDFAFIYPILTDGLLLRSHWDWRMWFGSWI